MTDFRAAFQAGQEAAILAELARKEISDVFVEICKQLADVTDGKVEIYRIEYEKQKDPFIFTLFAPKETFWAIAARNPKAEDSKPRQIALWEQDRSGYPCKITWGSIDHNCHDRESLEDCLVSLLGDAVVGEKLRGVMMLPPPQEAGSNTIKGSV